MLDVDVMCTSVRRYSLNSVQRDGGLVETLEGVRQGLLPARHLRKEELRAFRYQVGIAGVKRFQRLQHS